MRSRPLTVERLKTQQEQIALLRRTAESRVFGMLVPGAAMIGAVLVVAAIFLLDAVALRIACLALGVFMAVIVWTVGRAPHHIRMAAAATRKGRRVAATLAPQRVVIDRDSHDGTHHLHATLAIRTPRVRRWHMRLSASGWLPAQEQSEVQAVFLSDTEWPVLLVHRDGLLVPVARPAAVD